LANRGWDLDLDHFIVAGLFVVIVGFLLRRDRGWMAWSLALCTWALLAGQAVTLGLSVAFRSGVPRWYYADGCIVHSWITNAAAVLTLIGLCFSIPLFALIFRRLRSTSNQAMERTADR
jgi:uncharacterized membrane protein YhaH (DUF805 family)